MKIIKFLLIILFLFTIHIKNLLADDAKMLIGLEIFNETAGCAACHTLANAETSSQIGPNLDQIKPEFMRVLNIVSLGRGVMPAFENILTDKEIESVSYYVFKSTNK